MRRPVLRLRFKTFPIRRPLRTRFQALPIVDCSGLRPPPSPICAEFTGLSPEVYQFFFSVRESKEYFDEVYFALKDAIRHWDFADGKTLVIPVACTAGVHRSVAMAEELARRISMWRAAPFKLKVQVEHRNLWRCIVRQRDRCEENWMRYRELNRRVRAGRGGIVRRIYEQGLAVNVEWWTS